MRRYDNADRVHAELGRNGENVLLLDLRASHALELLASLLKARPETLVVALGADGSDPLREARAAGAYAAEDVGVDRVRLMDLVARAMEHARLIAENRLLREEAAGAAALRDVLAVGAARAEGAAPIQPARHLPGALRHFDNVEALLENLAEGVAGSVMVSRVGIFCRSRDAAGIYRLRAGLRCLEDTAGVEYGDGDPFVDWIRVNAHLICRAHLQHVRDGAARTLLARTLDQLGAEVVVPLQVRERLLGWLFVGHRATGLPFGQPELENLAIIGEHVSTTIENALLYEEVALQKTLAETLIRSMPTGIVAVDEKGVVRWYNSAAQAIFDKTHDEALGHDVEKLGARMAHAMREALAGNAASQAEEWSEPRTRRTLSVQTRRLGEAHDCLGAVALVQDITVERVLAAKQEMLDRATFWTELAAAMSHEIRNPLVAIKTFAQLLPERYEDEEFRAGFSNTVNAEVDRLNGIVDQINRFAHPHQLELKPMHVATIVKRALDAALQTQSSGVWVDTAIEEDLPQVDADEDALVECFCHVIANAMESLAGRDNAKIVLTAREYRDDEMPGGVAISVQDNGPGIRDDISSKVFSPFCTTKARGLGLGLPIAKRTIVDHGGRIEIESSVRGTCVTFLLPSRPRKERHETHTDSGRRTRKS